MPDTARREVGSRFHLMLPTATVDEQAPPWTSRSHVLTGTGRCALAVAIAAGRRHRGWQRIWIPGYFCQKVARYIASAELAVATYEDSPTGRPVLPETQPGDVVLLQNLFGLRAMLPCPDIDIIEDHTHDPTSPLARASTATVCIASLRKTAPIPDGAVVWTPNDTLPIEGRLPVVPAHEKATAEALSAMVLKAAWLAGQGVHKEHYRRLEGEAESQLATYQPARCSRLAQELIAGFPWDSWRAARRENWQVLKAALEGTAGLELGEPDSDAVPFMAWCAFAHRAHTAAIHQRLVAQRVYASTIWPLDNPVTPLPTACVNAAVRAFSLPIDGRYDAQTLQWVAAQLRDALDEVIFGSK